MVAQSNQFSTQFATLPNAGLSSQPAEKILCALCQLPAPRPISVTIAFVAGSATDSADGSSVNSEAETKHFCCYGCRHIYELIAPDLAQGISAQVAMGQAGLDLSAPCCRGVIHGDPAEEAQQTLSRLMFNAFLGMMVMALSLALYSDLFFTWGEGGALFRSMLQVLTMLFATPAVLMLALPILEDAVSTFQIYRRLTTSALIAIGTLAAYILSIYATLTGSGHTYFETATMTLLLVTLGRWLDLRSHVEGNKAIDGLLAQTPTEATLLLTSGEERLVAAAEVQVGDQIRVRPGENFAIDGLVLSGEGSVHEASITGEFTPAYKCPGSTVYAGTTNLDGGFVVQVTQVGEERVMGKLVRLLDEARLHRAPIERLADQVAGFFVPLVLVIALGTFGFWLWRVGLEAGVMNSLSVLLIACPCALGIATPLTLWTSLGVAARRGILVRESQALEKLSQVRHICFDKTGTLTTGESTLANRIVEPSIDLSTRELLQIAASGEQPSEHPLARSIVAAAAEEGIPLLPVTDFQPKAGLGIRTRLAGRSAGNLTSHLATHLTLIDEPILVGSWRLAEQEGLTLSSELMQARARLEAEGLTVIHVGWAGQVMGLLALQEQIRPTAADALASLREVGIQVTVLTGDSMAAGSALGRQLDVAVKWDLLPGDKLDFITAAEAGTTVAMIGDGINDAPSLARAGVGIAMGCGADVTQEAADINLLGTDLMQIPWLIALARRTYRTIRWNLLWAFLYNVTGIALAAAGLLHPILAALAMVLSSALVVGNGLRLKRVN